MRAHDLKYQTDLLYNDMWGSVYGSSIRYNGKGVFFNMSGLIEYLMEILS